MNDAGNLPVFSIIKSRHAAILFESFVAELERIGPIEIHPHKTMISFVNAGKHVAYLTQAGKSFIHIVFPLKRRYDDNLCFKRIQEVPGRRVIYHHFRMQCEEDLNDEVRRFMQMAYNG